MATKKKEDTDLGELLKELAKNWPIMVPIMIVHTICDELKYGARSLLAPSSTAITDIPAKNSVMYKNILLFKIDFFSISFSSITFIYLMQFVFSKPFFIRIGVYHYNGKTKTFFTIQIITM